MFRSTRRKIDQVSFIIAGAQKSGTTALHYYLAKHARITMGDQQEIHFFDDDAVFAAPPIDYEALHRHYPAVKFGTIAGDCTPSYLYHPEAAERIRDYDAGMKFIVLLRNPADRAFAHWNMQRFKRREPLDFSEAIRQEETRIKGAAPLDARRFAYVDRGFYARQLQRFLKFFRRDQLHVVKFEAFQKQQREVIDGVCRFIGLEPLRRFRSKDRNVVPYERVMNWEERIFLYNHFREDIAALEQMLGWDCSDWKL